MSCHIYDLRMPLMMITLLFLQHPSNDSNDEVSKACCHCSPSKQALMAALYCEWAHEDKLRNINLIIFGSLCELDVQWIYTNSVEKNMICVGIHQGHHVVAVVRTVIGVEVLTLLKSCAVRHLVPERVYPYGICKEPTSIIWELSPLRIERTHELSCFIHREFASDENNHISPHCFTLLM